MLKRVITILVLAALLCSTGDAASLPGLNFFQVPVPSLAIRFGLSSFRTIPGGVAFPGVAQAKSGEKTTAIRYLPKSPDGQRLLLTVKDATGAAHVVMPALYDWQLGPLVRYADDAKFDSLVSYRGERIVKINGRGVRGYRFQYHRAIEGQLLGLRIWHGDFLVFRPDLRSLDAARVDLPTDDISHNYILGSGERPPNVAANRKALLALQQARAGRKDERWSTYVITDKDRLVTYGLNKGRLILTGTPIWYFLAGSQQLRRVDASLAVNNMRAKQRAGGPYMKQHDVPMTEGETYAIEMASNELDSYLILEDSSGKILDEDDDSGAGLFDARIVFRAPKSATYRVIATTYAPGVVGKYTLTVNKVGVTPLPDYSNAITAVIEKNNGVNSNVYNALVTTMRYSALFRRIKADLPEAWQEFVKTVNDRQVGLVAETPTHIEVAAPLQ